MKHPQPTKAESSILAALWKMGSGTVRDVLNSIREETPDTGYTTILKLMQIMTEKGLLVRDTSRRTHVYKPAQPESKMKRQLVRELSDRVFDGAAASLILQALPLVKAKPEELAEIRKLIDTMSEEENE